MKTLKLLGAVTLCSALFAGAAVAQEGAVYSLNVVGFQKLEVKDSAYKYSLVATPFNADDASINEVIGAQLTGGTSYDNADDIMIWDTASQSYKLYWLVNYPAAPALHDKWMDNDALQIATNVDILPGNGFWIRSRQSVTQDVVLVGDVVDDAVITNSIVNGYQLCSYPFSASIAMNDLTMCTNGGHGGTSFDASDNIMKWDADSQTYKLYWLVDYPAAPALHQKWMDNDSLTITTDSIEPGEGFWYRHRSTGFDWVEPRPYDLD